MWKVYADIGWKMLLAAFTVMDASLTLVAIAIWAGAASPAFVAWVQNNTGIDDKWFWVPLAAVILHLFFKAMHERHLQWERTFTQHVIDTVARDVSASSHRSAEQREHLKSLRSLLSEQADEAEYLIMGDHFDSAAAKRWAERVQMIFKGNLSAEKANSWPASAAITERGQLTSLIVFLKSLIVQLRAEDLKR